MEEKTEKRKAFELRYEAYIKEFEDVGFTREQAEKIVYEFSKFKSI